MYLSENVEQKWRIECCFISVWKSPKMSHVRSVTKNGKMALMRVLFRFHWFFSIFLRCNDFKSHSFVDHSSINHKDETFFSYFQTQCCLWISERHFTVGKLPISSCLWVRGERSIMVAITNRRRSCLFPLVSNICVCFQYKEEERAHFHSPTKYNWKLAFFKIQRGGPLLPVWNWLLVYFP